jgi:hypothetical protein
VDISFSRQKGGSSFVCFSVCCGDTTPSLKSIRGKLFILHEWPTWWLSDAERVQLGAVLSAAGYR